MGQCCAAPSKEKDLYVSIEEQPQPYHEESVVVKFHRKMEMEIVEKKAPTLKEQHGLSEYLGVYESESDFKSSSKTVNDIIQNDDFLKDENVIRKIEEIQKQNKTQFPQGKFYINCFTYSQNKNKYRGFSQNQKKHGYGEYIWSSDGSIYQGYWENDKASGYGRIIFSDGTSYIGEWKNDQMHGQGKYNNVKEDKIYNGQWVNDCQSGYGEEVHQKFNVYKGSFKLGQKNGKGQFQWKDGSKYKGEFLNNMIHGQGTYIWPDNRIYQGLWHQGKMSGNGTYRWPDGRIYKGTFQNDKKHGLGIFQWPDGRQYNGNWFEGKQNGVGKFSKIQVDSKIKNYGQIDFEKCEEQLSFHEYSGEGIEEKTGKWEKGEFKGWIQEELQAPPTDINKLKSSQQNSKNNSNLNSNRTENQKKE